MLGRDRQVQLHAFDVSYVLQLIKLSPFSSLAAHRAVEMVGIDTLDASSLLRNAREQLIDDFLQNTINSFQCCYVMGYSPHRNTRAELDWINFQTEARSVMYSLLNLPPEASGMHVGYRRINSVIYLAIPTN